MFKPLLSLSAIKGQSNSCEFLRSALCILKSNASLIFIFGLHFTSTSFKMPRSGKKDKKKNKSWTMYLVPVHDMKHEFKVNFRQKL